MMASRHAISRLIHYDDDIQTISGHIQTITWSIQNFTVFLLFSILVELLSNVVQVETTLAIEFSLEVRFPSLWPVIVAYILQGACSTNSR
jgi:hypothetical protein